MKLCSRDRNSSHTLHTFASHRLSIVPYNTKKNSLLANDFKVPLLPRFILLLAESHLTSAQLNWRNTIFFEVFFFFVAKVLFDLISFRFQRSYIALPVAQKWEKIIALLNWNKANIRTRNWIKQSTHTHTLKWIFEVTLIVNVQSCTPLISKCTSRIVAFFFIYVINGDMKQHFVSVKQNAAQHRRNSNKNNISFIVFH